MMFTLSLQQEGAPLISSVPMEFILGNVSIRSTSDQCMLYAYTFVVHPAAHYAVDLMQNGDRPGGDLGYRRKPP